MSAKMNLDHAITSVRSSARRMNELYGRTVFDEWAIVSLLPNQGRVLDYSGPRREEFAGSFRNDLATLRSALLQGQHHFGDYEFARLGVGSKFDAFMCIGDGVYLICNNLYTTMEEITKDPRWLGAQLPFVELSESFRSDPVTYTA